MAPLCSVHMWPFIEALPKITVRWEAMNRQAPDDLGWLGFNLVWKKQQLATQSFESANPVLPLNMYLVNPHCVPGIKSEPP